MNAIGLWAGRVYGTNTGNLFVKLEQTPAGVSGTFHFNDAVTGVVIYSVNGSFADGTLQLEGDPIPTNREEETGGPINATAILTSQGNFRGEWRSSFGNAGTFELYPHDLPPPDQVRQSDVPIPEQLHTSRQTVGAIRLYAEDFRELVQVIRKDFVVGRLIVTYKTTEIESTRYVEEFEKEMTNLSKVQYLKFLIQEPEAHGINKLAIVELNSQGCNEAMVQGIYESWVMGKADILVNQLQRYEKSLVTNIKKYGLGINQLIVMAMLVLFPEVETLWQRSIFAIVVAGIALAFFGAHRRFLPNLILYTSPRKPNALRRAWPSILSWIIAATASLVAAVAFYLLTQQPPL